MNAQDFDAEPRSLSQENLKRCRSGPGRRGFELSEGADYARACAVAYLGGLKERCLRNPQMPGGRIAATHRARPERARSAVMMTTLPVTSTGR